ncbi:MAG: LysE family transporter [Caldilineales bacterium]
MPFLLLGLSLGLSAGFSPGPLLALVITTTLQRGLGAGIRVAAAPLLSDLPIILLAVTVLDLLPAWTLAAVSLAGGVYVVYLGWETLRVARAAGQALLADLPQQSKSQNVMRRGALVNLLSPHPYLFWAAVGGPTLLNAWQSNPLYAAAYLLGFYSTLIGSKIAIAALVHSQARWFTGPWYGRVLAALGLLLIILGLMLVWHGLQLLR